MNPLIIGAAVRALLQVVGAFLVTKGIITAEEAKSASDAIVAAIVTPESIGGAVLIVGSLGWSIFQKKKLGPAAMAKKDGGFARVDFMLVLIIGLFFVAAGCSLLPAKTEQTLIRHAKALSGKYCEQPYDARLLVREEVNSAISPHRVKVTCAGDPE